MRPIYDEIARYIKGDAARFHMPAHFGLTDAALYASAPFDITELDFSDNLQNPTGIILESERLAARDYGAEKCFYFTSGATTAIFTALACACAREDDIIIERASHKSVYSAARLFGLRPTFIPPTFFDGVPVPVTADEVERAISACPTAKAVVITSPNYFGQTADGGVSEVCKKHGVRLIVDGAHGAHFPFSNLLPKGFSDAADICVVSLHKTLAVYSGGAALLCNDNGLFDKITRLRADLHTTSPSYLILASMDCALDDMRRGGEKAYARLFEKVGALKARLKNISFLDNDDFTRLVAKVGKNGIEKLKESNVVPEAVYGDYAIFILSPKNAHLLVRLENALSGLTPQTGVLKTPVYPAPVRGDDGDLCELLPLEKAIGRTSHYEVGVYPPGIPVVARGEVITPEVAEILSGGDTFGFVNNEICVTIKGNK